MSEILLPAGVIDIVRAGLRGEIAKAAQDIDVANEQIDEGEHPERYQQPLCQIDAFRELLGEIGWADPPIDHRIDLDVHGWALMHALTSEVAIHADMVAEIDHNDSRRRANNEQPRRAALIKDTLGLSKLAVGLLVRDGECHHKRVRIG